MRREGSNSLSICTRQSRREQAMKPGSIKRKLRVFLYTVLALACGSCLFATEAKAIDVANQTDWNTAVAAVAAAGANSTVDINITSGFTLSSSLAQIQAGNTNVTVNITGNSQTINGASSFQGIQVNGANAPTVNISNLSVANTATIGGMGQNGQNGYYSSGLSYGSGGGGGGGLGAGGGLLVGSGANVTLASVTFTGNTATGGTGGTGGSAQNTAADPVNGGNGGAGGAANNGGSSGGGGAGGTGGHAGGQGTAGTAGASFGGGGGGGGGSGTTSSTSYTINNAGGAGNSNGGSGGAGGDGVTNNAGSGGPGSDGGFGGAGGAARGGAIYVATGGTLTILDTPISGSAVVGGAGGSAGVGQGPSSFNGTAGAVGSAQGAAIYLSGVTANIGVSTGTVTYANTIAGTGGSLIKSGDGTLSLSGSNTYTGSTTVNAGTLAVNGSITSPVTVNTGGSLGGNGTINSSVSIQSGGIFAPGNSIGTTTVNGSLTFAAGSVYRVEADAAGTSDRINVTGTPGTATISGGTVDVQAGAGTYQASTQYTILNATGGVTGAFSTVTSNLAFLTPLLSYDPNNVFLTLNRNDMSYASVAITPNQVAAATVLQNSVGATGDMATVMTALTGLSAPQSRSAFDAVGGASIIALRRSGSAYLNGFGAQLNRRLGLVVVGDAAVQMTAFNSPIRLAANESLSDVQPLYAQALSKPAGKERNRQPVRGLWIQGYGGAQNTDGDDNASGSRLRSVGISGGIDGYVGEDLVLGAAISIGTSRVSYDDSSDSGHSRNNALGFYGSYVTGPWSFKGIAGVSLNNNSLQRHVTVGTLARIAKADFDSRDVSLYGEAAYDIKLSRYVLQPIVALSYLGTRADGFTESGAGALNLDVDGQTTKSTRSLIGARMNYDFDKLKLQARALWAHEFGNVNAPLAASFSGAPAAGTFYVSGVELKRDSLVLGLDASGEIRKGVNLFVSAQAEGNSRQRGFALFGGASKSF
jgi:outer membrane autotransporter protein